MSKRRDRYQDTHNLDEATSRQIGGFVFPDEPEPSEKKGEIDPEALAFSRALLPSSIITGKNMAMAISYYSTLRDLYDSKSAMVLVNILQKISMAHEGKRADQGARILEGSLPREIEVETTQV